MPSIRRINLGSKDGPTRSTAPENLDGYFVVIYMLDDFVWFLPKRSNSRNDLTGRSARAHRFETKEETEACANHWAQRFGPNFAELGRIEMISVFDYYITKDMGELEPAHEKDEFVERLKSTKKAKRAAARTK